jgi:hypothetical protein
MQLSKAYEIRLKWVGWAVSAALLVIILVNSLLPMINLVSGIIELPYLLPAIIPSGVDFRKGLYYPAEAVLRGDNPYSSRAYIYPPFAAVFSIPFRLFPVQTAYYILVMLLFLFNIGSIFLALQIAENVFPKNNGNGSFERSGLFYSVFWGVSALTLSTYGFIFSVERGNVDIFPIFFSLLALWVLIKKPGWLWPQVLLVAIATHLKIYPAVLFVLLLWKHGWKSLLPIFVVNTLLLFISGPANGIEFIRVIIQYSNSPYIAVFNHSAASFGSFVNNHLINSFSLMIPPILFVLAPVLIWVVGAYVLWKRKYSSINAVLLFLVSVPLMNLIPSTSHDYKLVILSSAVAICVYFLCLGFASTGKWRYIFQLVALMTIMYFITRSYTMLPTMLASKYPFILMIQGIFLLTVFSTPATPIKAEPGQTIELNSQADAS